jgi:hypothetical protein
MCFGIALGAVWELIEFAFDWFANANLQKSNADTATDILTNNVGAIFGTLLGLWIYRHHSTQNAREDFGRVAEWLTARFASMLQRHGRLMGVGVAVLTVGIVAAGFLMDRVPALPASPPNSLAPFETSLVGQAPDQLQPLAQQWTPSSEGLCLFGSPGEIRPGSEKMGLVEVAPGSPPGDFTLTTRYHLERPKLGEGTAMEAGLAFGIRDAENFYLARVSALHDVISLERYINGKRRQGREERLRTRGDEAHELTLELRGEQAVLLLDGQPRLSEHGFVDAAGGVGLWARVTRSACFSELRLA